MGQEVFRQSNFTNGELDPKMIARRDIKPYYASLAQAENLQTTAQGPILRRMGLAFVDYLRNPLALIDLSGATLAAPEGGTAADALTGGDNSPLTTTAMGTVNPYVVLTVDFGAPQRVSAVDLLDIAVVPSGDDGSGYTGPPVPIQPFPGGPIDIGIDRGLM